MRDSHGITLNYTKLNFKFNYAASFIITDKMLIFFNSVLQPSFGTSKALFCPQWKSCFIKFLQAFWSSLVFIINTI
jgi:hypothetical protein